MADENLAVWLIVAGLCACQAGVGPAAPGETGSVDTDATISPVDADGDGFASTASGGASGHGRASVWMLPVASASQTV